MMVMTFGQLAQLNALVFPHYSDPPSSSFMMNTNKLHIQIVYSANVRMFDTKRIILSNIHLLSSDSFDLLNPMILPSPFDIFVPKESTANKIALNPMQKCWYLINFPHYSDPPLHIKFSRNHYHRSIGCKNMSKRVCDSKTLFSGLRISQKQSWIQLQRPNIYVVNHNKLIHLKPRDLGTFIISKGIAAVLRFENNLVLLDHICVQIACAMQSKSQDTEIFILLDFMILDKNWKMTLLLQLKLRLERNFIYFTSRSSEISPQHIPNNIMTFNRCTVSNQMLQADCKLEYSKLQFFHYSHPPWFCLSTQFSCLIKYNTYNNIRSEIVIYDVIEQQSVCIKVNSYVSHKWKDKNMLIDKNKSFTELQSDIQLNQQTLSVTVDDTCANLNAKLVFGRRYINMATVYKSRYVTAIETFCVCVINSYKECSTVSYLNFPHFSDPPFAVHKPCWIIIPDYNYNVTSVLTPHQMANILCYKKRSWIAESDLYHNKPELCYINTLNFPHYCDPPHYFPSWNLGKLQVIKTLANLNIIAYDVEGTITQTIEIIKYLKISPMLDSSTVHYHQCWSETDGHITKNNTTMNNFLLSIIQTLENKVYSIKFKQQVHRDVSILMNFPHYCDLPMRLLDFSTILHNFGLRNDCVLTANTNLHKCDDTCISTKSSGRTHRKEELGKTEFIFCRLLRWREENDVLMILQHHITPQKSIWVMNCNQCSLLSNVIPNSGLKHEGSNIIDEILQSPMALLIDKNLVQSSGPQLPCQLIYPWKNKQCCYTQDVTYNKMTTKYKVYYECTILRPNYRGVSKQFVSFCAKTLTNCNALSYFEDCCYEGTGLIEFQYRRGKDEHIANNTVMNHYHTIQPLITQTMVNEIKLNQQLHRNAIDFPHYCDPPMYKWNFSTILYNFGYRYNCVSTASNNLQKYDDTILSDKSSARTHREENIEELRFAIFGLLQEKEENDTTLLLMISQHDITPQKFVWVMNCTQVLMSSNCTNYNLLNNDAIFGYDGFNYTYEILQSSVSFSVDKNLVQNFKTQLQLHCQLIYPWKNKHYHILIVIYKKTTMRIVYKDCRVSREHFVALSSGGPTNVEQFEDTINHAILVATYLKISISQMLDSRTVHYHQFRSDKDGHITNNAAMNNFLALIIHTSVNEVYSIKLKQQEHRDVSILMNFPHYCDPPMRLSDFSTILYDFGFRNDCVLTANTNLHKCDDTCISTKSSGRTHRKEELVKIGFIFCRLLQWREKNDTILLLQHHVIPQKWIWVISRTQSLMLSNIICNHNSLKDGIMFGCKTTGEYLQYSMALSVDEDLVQHFRTPIHFQLIYPWENKLYTFIQDAPYNKTATKFCHSKCTIVRLNFKGINKQFFALSGDHTINICDYLNCEAKMVYQSTYGLLHRDQNLTTYASHRNLELQQVTWLWNTFTSSVVQNVIDLLYRNCIVILFIILICYLSALTIDKHTHGYTVLHTERYERLPVENQPATSLNWSNLSPLLQDSNDFNVGERGILDFLNENPPTKNSPSSSSNTTANFISNTVPVPEVNNDESSMEFVSFPSNLQSSNVIKRFDTTWGTGGNNDDFVVHDAELVPQVEYGEESGEAIQATDISLSYDDSVEVSEFLVSSLSYDGSVEVSDFLEEEIQFSRYNSRQLQGQFELASVIQHEDEIVPGEVLTVEVFELFSSIQDTDNT